ncbi:phenylacetyl-CoA ligase-like protein [Usnea florida]
MVFLPPQWVPKLPSDPPDSIPISEFMLNEQYGRCPLSHALQPFTCGLTGFGYSALEVRDRVDKLARALSKELGWTPNEGAEWDKVIGIFSVNTIDTIPLSWAVHSLSGIVSPANAAYSRAELEYQLKSSGSKALFTCLPLLPIAIEAAANSGISRNRVYLLALPKEATGGLSSPPEFQTVDQLIEKGEKLPQLEKLQWKKGAGSEKTAYLCYSSGTSGLPKGVMISHRNVISNVLQITAFEKPYRESVRQPGGKYVTEVALGLLPQSHIYALVVICHATTYRGDQVISLPKFDLQHLLNSIQNFKINTLFLVPPIIIVMAKNKPTLDKFDLNSVQAIFTGAAPLGAETAQDLQSQYPSWAIRQGYGLTETSTVICSTPVHDVWPGSSGSLLPSVQAKIVSIEGTEMTGYDQPGELVVKSPSVVLGYLNNDKANQETFEDGWMRTGDEAVVRKSAQGNEHIFIVDRIKELIKVKV